MKLTTVRRWISEAGGESLYQETDVGREMLSRIEGIESRFSSLDTVRARTRTQGKAY